MRFAIVAVLALIACRPPGWDKGDDAPATDAAVGGDAQPDAAVETECQKGFRLDGHAAATTVWVTGDFVSWAGDPGAGAFELAKDGADVWMGTRAFDEGSYQYKFIIDGTSWITDPANPNVVDDGFGGSNSVYTCTP